MSSPAGSLIIFDGIDGVGKSSQIELARAALSKEHQNVISLRYLGSTPIGEALRKIYLSKLERPAQTTIHIATAIMLALVERVEQEKQGGKIILMDRGPLSLAAYQIYGDQMDMSYYSYVDEAMKLLAPDLIILYDLKVEKAFERKKVPEKADYFESKPLDYFNRVRQAYLTMAKQYPQVDVIGADNSIDAIHALTMQAITKQLV